MGLLMSLLTSAAFIGIRSPAELLRFFDVSRKTRFKVTKECGIARVIRSPVVPFGSVLVVSSDSA